MHKTYFKTPIIRKKGKAYEKLQAEVLADGDNICEICGHWTEAPPHHSPKVSQGGQDRKEDMHIICCDCHDEFPNWKPKDIG
jgi:hypothetical protein